MYICNYSHKVCLSIIIIFIQYNIPLSESRNLTFSKIKFRVENFDKSTALWLILWK